MVCNASRRTCQAELLTLLIHWTSRSGIWAVPNRRWISLPVGSCGPGPGPRSILDAPIRGKTAPGEAAAPKRWLNKRSNTCAGYEVERKRT